MKSSNRPLPSTARRRVDRASRSCSHPDPRRRPARHWKGLLPDRRVQLGLDLQGGTHLVLTVDVDKAVESTLDRNLDDIKREATDAKVGRAGPLTRRGNRLVVSLANADSRTAFTDLIKERFPNLTIETSSTTDGRPSLRAGVHETGRTALARLCDGPVAGDHPQPHRPVRRHRADHPAAGGHRHPDPAPRHPGPAARQGSDRQDRAARVQVCSNVPSADNYIAGTQPLPAGTEVLSGEPEAGTGRASACSTSSSRTRS